jgi:hypothetical protein
VATQNEKNSKTTTYSLKIFDARMEK